MSGFLEDEKLRYVNRVLSIVPQKKRPSFLLWPYKKVKQKFYRRGIIDKTFMNKAAVLGSDHIYGYSKFGLACGERYKLSSCGAIF